MAVVVTLCALLLLALVVFVVSAPLRAAARREAHGVAEPVEAHWDEAAEREQLEVAREAKYREIRDAELDYRTGKLTERDYRELDAELRAEALAILDRLEAAGATPTDASAARSRSRRTGP